MLVGAERAASNISLRREPPRRNAPAGSPAPRFSRRSLLLVWKSTARLQLKTKIYILDLENKKRMIQVCITRLFFYSIFSRNTFALSDFGDVKNSAGGASSTSMPLSKNNTLSATSRAKPISCVTIAIVIPV